MSDLIRDTLNEYTEDQNHRAYKDRLRNGDPSPAERDELERQIRDDWDDYDRALDLEASARFHNVPFTPRDRDELQDWLDTRL